MLKLPNLELLEYVAMQAILKDKECMNLINEAKDKYSYYYFNLECEVFMQTWSSTSTGFDVMPNGEPTFGGQAITDEYTTVFKEELVGIYVVFFGNKLCYIVNNPTKEFFYDLKNKKLKSLSFAKKCY